MSDEIVRAGFITEEHLTFLDELRESGETNMYGAVPFIEEMFPDLSRDEALRVLTYWMKTFTTRQMTRGDS